MWGKRHGQERGGSYVLSHAECHMMLEHISRGPGRHSTYVTSREINMHPYPHDSSQHRHLIFPEADVNLCRGVGMSLFSETTLITMLTCSPGMGMLHLDDWIQPPASFGHPLLHTVVQNPGSPWLCVSAQGIVQRQAPYVPLKLSPLKVFLM